MEKVEDSLKYKDWHAALTKQRIQIQKVEELHTVRKPNGSVLFTMLQMQAHDENGTPLLPTVLLRGHFVSVVTVLINKETKEELFLLVKQRRVGNGAIFYEHPAGMCDSEGDPVKVAYKEVEEETGLDIKDAKLVLLSDKMFYSSPGLLDEGGFYFCCEIEMESADIEKFRNKLTGADNEAEFIETTVCTLEETMQKLENAHAMLHLFVYLQYKNRLMIK